MLMRTLFFKQLNGQYVSIFSHSLSEQSHRHIQAKNNGQPQSKNLEFVNCQNNKNIKKIQMERKKRVRWIGEDGGDGKAIFAVIMRLSLIIWMALLATPPSKKKQSVFGHFAAERRGNWPKSPKMHYNRMLQSIRRQNLQWACFQAISQSFQLIQVTFYMKNSPSFCMLLALMLLLHHPAAALNWQGTGELNNDNLTLIWAYIQANLAANSSSGSLKAFTVGLSDQLNNAWDQAWNVVTVKSYFSNPTYFDALVYGYAFRNHWMWFNGYKTPSISTPFSFVIWKDYNCQNWKTFGSQIDGSDQISGFTVTQRSKVGQIISQFQNLLLTDPWYLAKTIVDEVQGSSDFVTADDRAYSVVLLQCQEPRRPQIHARVCAVGNQYYDTMRQNPNQCILTVSGTKYGRLILFRTR